MISWERNVKDVRNLRYRDLTLRNILLQLRHNDLKIMTKKIKQKKLTFGHLDDHLYFVKFLSATTLSYSHY